jgi:hypothetical protein
VCIVNDKKARRAMGMRIFANGKVLTKAARHASSLAPDDPRNCPGRSCALRFPAVLGGLAQMNPSAVEA